MARNGVPVKRAKNTSIHERGRAGGNSGPPFLLLQKMNEIGEPKIVEIVTLITFRVGKEEFVAKVRIFPEYPSERIWEKINRIKYGYQEQLTFIEFERVKEVLESLIGSHKEYFRQFKVVPEGSEEGSDQGVVFGDVGFKLRKN